MVYGTNFMPNMANPPYYQIGNLLAIWEVSNRSTYTHMTWPLFRSWGQSEQQTTIWLCQRGNKKHFAIRMKKMMKWITANEDLIHYSKNDGN